MRRMNTPLCFFAKSQFNTATRALPTCRLPVGLGANRVRTVSACEEGMDLSSQLFREPWDLRDLLGRRRAQGTHAAEPLEQGLLPCRADAGNLPQLAGQRTARPQLAVVRDGEPVRLVPDPLEQAQRRAGTGEAQRLAAVREIDLLLSLGQCADRRVTHTERFERGERRRELPLAAVDDRQFGQRPPFVEPPPEVAPDDLGDGAEVIVAPIPLDAEAAVLALVGLAVLEHDGAADDLAALRMRDVEADHQPRHDLQVQRLLEVVEDVVGPLAYGLG